MHSLVSSTTVSSTRRITDSIAGVALVLLTETMYFAALVSAYLVARSGATAWPPFGQPRLPVHSTAFNTLVLLGSAWALGRAFWLGKQGKPSRAFEVLAFGLGAAFVILQGREWLRLIQFGLTTTSSLYGAFFYLIVGSHALHAIAGLAILGTMLARKNRKTPSPAFGLYWMFVVALWPILYALVYIL